MHIDSYICTDSPARGRRESEPGKGQKHMMTTLARLFNEWKRSGAVRRELSHLSDRELADIGITRSDIDRIATDNVHR